MHRHAGSLTVEDGELAEVDCLDEGRTEVVEDVLQLLAPLRLEVQPDAAMQQTERCVETPQHLTRQRAAGGFGGSGVGAARGGKRSHSNKGPIHTDWACGLGLGV